MRSVLKNKFTWLLIGLALFVGVLYVAPELLIWKKLADQGRPYVLSQLTHHGDEAYGTFSRFREIYDGHFPPGDLYFDSQAVTPFGPFQIMPLLMAGFIYMTSGDINTAYLLATFLLAPILFLLFYWLGKIISGNKIYAIFIALLGVMTPMFRSLPESFRTITLFLNNVVKYFVPLIQTPLAKLPLGRTEDPLLTYLVFLPVIATLLIFWKKPNWKSGAVTGSLIGLMFYVYFHYWVFLVIVAGLIGLFALFNLKKDRAFFKSCLALGLALVVIAIPYWANFLTFRGSSTASEVTARIGVETSRTLFFIGGEPAIFHYVFYGLLAGLIYFVFYRRGQERTAILYWIFNVAMFVVWNVQVITGFVPSPDHWFRPISAFIFVILLHMLYELIKRFNYKTAMICLMFVSALLVSKKIVNALVFINPPQEFIAEKTFESRNFNPSIVDSWTWINSNLPNEPKIISPSFITSLYLNAQTSARPYLAGGFNTAAPNTILEDRFLSSYNLFKVTPAFLRDTLETDYQEMVCTGECINDDHHRHLNIKETLSYLYVGYYVNDPERMPRSEGKYRFISKEKADELFAKYPNISVTWRDVEAEYVYYGPWEKQITQIDLSSDPDLELIYKNAEVEIYKIRR